VNPRVDAPALIAPCAASVNSSTVFSRWVFVPGDNLSVRLEGYELCLDAGASPSNNGPAKLYTCYPGLSQQQYVCMVC
jgi:hypothetical protein